MDRYGTQYEAQAGAGFVRARAAFACAMPAAGSWSSMPVLGVTITDHKPGRPRRPRVDSP